MSAWKSCRGKPVKKNFNPAVPPAVSCWCRSSSAANIRKPECHIRSITIMFWLAVNRSTPGYTANLFQNSRVTESRYDPADFASSSISVFILTHHSSGAYFHAHPQIQAAPAAKVKHKIVSGLPELPAKYPGDLILITTSYRLISIARGVPGD